MEPEDDTGGFDTPQSPGNPIPTNTPQTGMPSTDIPGFGDQDGSGRPGLTRDITFPNGGSLLRRGNFGFELSNAYSEYIVSKPHRVAVRELDKFWAARGLQSYHISRYDLNFTVTYGGRSIPVTMTQSDYKDKVKREQAIQQAIQGVMWADLYNQKHAGSAPELFPDIDWGSSGDDPADNAGNYVYNEIANPGQYGFDLIGSGLHPTTDGNDQGSDEPTTSDIDLDDMSLYSDPENSDDDDVDYGDFEGMF